MKQYPNTLILFSKNDFLVLIKRKEEISAKVGKNNGNTILLLSVGNISSLKLDLQYSSL